MKNRILTLSLILTLAIAVAADGGQRKFKIAYFLPGNGSTQYTVIAAPDAMTAQQVFKATFTTAKFSSYTEIK
jgi:hypothetical protein